MNKTDKTAELIKKRVMKVALITDGEVIESLVLITSGSGVNVLPESKSF